jgi:hypothetical protein
MVGPLEVRVDGEPVTLRGGKPRVRVTAAEHAAASFDK